MDILKRWILPIGVILCGTVLVTSALDRASMPRHIIWCAMTLILLVCAKELRLGKIHIFAFGYLVFVLVSGLFAINKSEWLYWTLRTALMVSFLSVVVIDEKLLAKAMIVLGMIFAVYFWYDFFQVDGFRFCRGLMRQRNTWAIAHFFVIPFCYYAITKGFWRKISILTLSVMVVHIVLLGSRSAMLAVFVSAGIVFIVHSKLRLYLLAIGFFGAAFVSSKMLDTTSLHYRFIQWKPTMSMIADYPLGVGAGNWWLLFPKYAPDIDYPQAYTKKIFRFPHNDFLWVWSETGPGIIFYLGMFLTALYYAWKRKAIYLIIALSGYMAMAFFSVLRERPFSSLMMMVFIAMACERKYVLKQTELVLVTLVFALVVFGFRLRSSYWNKKLVNAKTTSQMMEATKGYSVFSTLTYTGVPWHFFRASLLVNKRQAAACYKMAYRHNPYDIRALNGMGIATGNKAYFNEALTICPHFEP